MYLFSWMVVDKRTVLNENPKRVRVRWTTKRGEEIDLIGQLIVAWFLSHSRLSARLAGLDLGLQDQAFFSGPSLVKDKAKPFKWTFLPI